MTSTSLIRNPKVRPLPKAQRDEQILALRSVGTPIQVIADRLGIGERTVRRVTDRRIAELNAEITAHADRIRAQHLMELAMLRRRLTTALTAADPGERLGACRAWLSVLERESRLLGLDAPAKVELAAQAAASEALLQHLADRLPADTMEQIVGALTES